MRERRKCVETQQCTILTQQWKRARTLNRKCIELCLFEHFSNIFRKPLILCEIFNTVGAFMRILDKAQKKRKFGICNKIRLIHICCIVVHVMLPVIRLSLHDDDDDVKVKMDTRWLAENYPYNVIQIIKYMFILELNVFSQNAWYIFTTHWSWHKC